MTGRSHSTNGGNTWRLLAASQRTGLPRRIGVIAVDPFDAHHLRLAGVTHAASDPGGLFVSHDGGQTWRQETFVSGAVFQWCHDVKFHPTVPGTIVATFSRVGAHSGIWRSTDGGQTWTHLLQGLPAPELFHRATLAYAPSQPDTLYALVADTRAQDGDGLLGVFRSQNGGNTWINVTGRSIGREGQMSYGNTIARADQFFEKFGGDGGWMVYDPTDPTHMWVTWQFMGLVHFRGNSMQEVTLSLTEAEMRGVWMVYLTLDPNNTSTVFTGSCRIWRTQNDGEMWQPVSRILDGSPVSAIEVAPANSNLVYVGTENGGIFRSLDGGDNWSGNLAGGLLPGRVITRLESHPADANHLLLTVAGEANSHLFESTDGGINWTELDQGRLPRAPHHAVIIPPDDARSIYVCSDAGVYHSPDFGQTWTNLSRNLPTSWWWIWSIIELPVAVLLLWQLLKVDRLLCWGCHEALRCCTGGP